MTSFRLDIYYHYAFLEPPRSIAIIQNQNQVPQGGEITVVDGQVSTA